MDIQRVNLAQTQTTHQGSRTTAAKTDATPQEVKDNVSLGGDTGQAAAPKKWTIMHYTAADNNLKQYLVSDVNEMEVVGSTKNMNLIVQLDQGGTNCKRYYLEADNDPRAINSPVLQEMGNTNMADPKVLADFIKFSMEKYPAQHYALIIGDHGGGWKGAIEDEGSHGWMTTPQIREALEEAEAVTGKKIDVLGFDCCQMASTEVADEISENVGFMVGSQENEGGNGWPYTPLLTPSKMKSLDRAMSSRLNISPEELAKKMVTNAETDQYSLPTLSAVDLSKMPEMKEAINSFAEQIIATETPNAVLKGLARKTQTFSGSYRDQHHFAELVTKSTDITDDKLKKAAEGVMKATEEAVIANQHSNRAPNARGLHLDMPNYGGVSSGYKELKFAKTTLWDEAMNKLNGK